MSKSKSKPKPESLNELRWKYDEDVLLLNNPLEGGSRYTFFVQLILARAEGKVKVPGYIGLVEFIGKNGLDRSEFIHSQGLKRMTQEANRIPPVPT